MSYNLTYNKNKNNVIRSNVLYLGDCELITKYTKSMISSSFVADEIGYAHLIMHTFQIDIVMVDIKYLDFVKFLRLKDKHIDIIIISNKFEVNHFQTVIPLKVSNYFAKPFSFNEIHKFLANLVKKSSLKSHRIYLSKHTYYDKVKTTIVDTKRRNTSVLSYKENLLLDHLLHSEELLSQEKMKKLLWPTSKEVSTSAIKALLNRFRNKIGKEVLKNVSKAGYYLDLK